MYDGQNLKFCTFFLQIERETVKCLENHAERELPEGLNSGDLILQKGEIVVQRLRAEGSGKAQKKYTWTA